MEGRSVARAAFCVLFLYVSVFFYLFFFLYSLFLSFDFSHCPPLFCYFMAFFGVVRVGKMAFHSEK